MLVGEALAPPERLLAQFVKGVTSLHRHWKGLLMLCLSADRNSGFFGEFGYLSDFPRSEADREYRGLSLMDLLRILIYVKIVYQHCRNTKILHEVQQRFGPKSYFKSISCHTIVFVVYCNMQLSAIKTDYEETTEQI